MEDIIEETKSKTTLIEIVYNDSSDLKKLASKEEFRTFIIKDSLESIKNALKYGDDKVELFNIFNLSLTVELKRSNFKSVLNNITKYYINDEDYEMCNQIKKLIDEI
jgi:hypothetical protein